MARKPALNIDALKALGAEKLARLVLDEAGQNAAFRKVVSAALASSKGPEAIAKIVDRRLSALERARSFIEWDKAKAFEKDLSATVKVTAEELGQASPDMAVDRLLRFIAALEAQKPQHTQNTIGMAQRLLDAGRAQEALTWIRKERRPAIAYMRAADLADGLPPRDPASPVHAQLEARILEALGDREGAQALRWSSFEVTLQASLLRDYLDALDDFEEFDALDRAFAHALEARHRHLALDFLLEWPKLDVAARLVVDNHTDWNGRQYSLLVPPAETLEADHPLAATVLCRACLDEILAQARSKAYGHGGRYLAKLDRLAERIDKDAFSSAGIASHAEYRLRLLKQHGRKAAFWANVPS